MHNYNKHNWNSTFLTPSLACTPILIVYSIPIPILTSTKACSFWLVFRYEVCSTHLPAAIAARYFSLQLGLPTMTCVQLGEPPGISTLLPQAPQQ